MTPKQTPSSFEDQITAASEFFAPRRSRFASDCLLKPDRAHHPLEVGRLTATDIGRLGAFDIIGVTEKDLGGRIVDRLVAVATLRDALTRIHVFEALDPLLVPLFFAAGADIFDGLGWLRYAYHDYRPLLGWGKLGYRAAEPDLAGQSGDAASALHYEGRAAVVRSLPRPPKTRV